MGVGDGYQSPILFHNPCGLGWWAGVVGGGRCPIQGCDSRYRSAKYVKRHLRTREEKAGHGLTDLSPYTCPLCPAEVLGKEEMRRHKRGHTSSM